MSVFFDFHTHNSNPPPGVTALISRPAPLPDDGKLYSLELHPWHCGGPELPAGFRENAVRAAGIGEIGLDRLRGPELSLQRQVLRAALEVAAELHKPVILHCVRAAAELQSDLKPYPGMKKLLHGFRGGVRELERWLELGFFVSLAPTALRPEFAPFAAARIGLETDDGEMPIAELYRRAGALFGADFTAVNARNFKAFLGIQLS
ncbi:MAG: TatD family hydrolase [Victivallaceae bacterium]